MPHLLEICTKLLKFAKKISDNEGCNKKAKDQASTYKIIYKIVFRATTKYACIDQGKYRFDGWQSSKDCIQWWCQPIYHVKSYEWSY